MEYFHFLTNKEYNLNKNSNFFDFKSILFNKSINQEITIVIKIDNYIYYTDTTNIQIFYEFNNIRIPVYLYRYNSITFMITTKESMEYILSINKKIEI